MSKSRLSYKKFKDYVYKNEIMEKYENISVRNCNQNSECHADEFCFQESVGLLKYCKKKLDDYEPCLQNTDCKIGYCNRMQCRKKKRTETCEENHECISGKCVQTQRLTLGDPKVCM